MKLKYYLRGCGVGILVTVVILMIALKAKGGVMTDKKVMERASELGMVMQEEMTELLETQTISESQNIPDTEENSDTQNVPESQIVSETQKPSEPQMTPDDGTDSKQDNTANPEDTEDSESSGEKISITVKSGEVCRDVAGKLFDQGLVEDAEEFRIYMGEHGYAKNLRVGSFSFRKGMTYEEIAKILTKKS